MKVNDNKNRIINSIFMALIPSCICVVNLLLSRSSVFKVSLLSSSWNDELFYYKQVEAVLANGIPNGYFGFNESQAPFLTFAAWSPVILLPWVLWGLIFGWHLYSPFLCNVVILSASLAYFSWKTNIKTVSIGLFSVQTILFLPLSRYLLSSMPETNVISLSIVFFALFINELYSPKKSNRILMHILVVIATLTRPYLILFAIFPMYAEGIIKKVKVIISICVAAVSMIMYAIINKLLAAPYLTPIFSLEWLHVYIRDGIAAGNEYLFRVVGNKFVTLFSYNIPEAFKNKNSTGAYFTTLILFFLYWMIKLCLYIINGEKKNAILALGLWFLHLAMFFAVILMYKLNEGSRHFIWLISLDILLFVLHQNKAELITNVALACVVGFLFFGGIKNRENYLAPTKSELDQKIESVYDELNNLIPVTDTMSWDNDVIWLYSDIIRNDAEESDINVCWNYLYAMPKGIGINCCTYDYIVSNLDSLKSKYIMLIPESETEKALRDKGADILFENEDIVIMTTRSL